MASGWVEVRSETVSHKLGRGPYLHKNPGQTGDETLFFPFLTWVNTPETKVMVAYSSDYGDTWSELTLQTIAAGNVSYSDIAFDVGADRMHIALLLGEGSGAAAEVRFYRLNMNTISQEGSAETVHTSFTVGDSDNSWAIMRAVARTSIDSSGNGMVLYYRGPRYRTMGSNYETGWTAYKRSGSWNTAEVTPTTTQQDYRIMDLFRGTSDTAHFTYVQESTASSTHYARQISTSDSLSSAGNQSTAYNDYDYFYWWPDLGGDSRNAYRSINSGGTEYFISGDFNQTDTSQARRYSEGAPMTHDAVYGFSASHGDSDSVPHFSVSEASEYFYALAYHNTGIGTPNHIDIYESTDAGATWSFHGTADEADTVYLTAPYESRPGRSTFVRDDTGDEMFGYIIENGSNPGKIFYGDYLIASGVQTLTVTHTADASVGFYVDHTADATISEFPGPTDTRPAKMTSDDAHKLVISGNRQWLVGVNIDTVDGYPDTIRLWEGPVGAVGEGFWQLHEFAHGSNMIMSPAIAATDDGKIHVVYTHAEFAGSQTSTQYHIVWDPVAESWANNGAFGNSQSHSDPNAVDGARLDMVHTDDDELLVASQNWSYVFFSPYNTYRAIYSLYKSNNHDFGDPGASSEFKEIWYGPNAFDRPGVGTPHLFQSGNNAYALGRYGTSHWDGTTEGDRFYLHFEGILAYFQEVGVSPERFATTHNGRIWLPWWRTESPNRIAYGIASAAVDADPLMFDEWYVLEKDGVWDAFGASGFGVFIDHYNNPGAHFYLTDNDPEPSEQYRVVYVNDGMGNFHKQLHTPTGQAGDNYRPTSLIDRSWGGWSWPGNDQPWTSDEFTITTWYRSHTTDAIVGLPETIVQHTTDAFIATPFHTTSFESATMVKDQFVQAGSNYYMVTKERSNGEVIYIFETPDPASGGRLVSTLSPTDLGENFQHALRDFDFINVSGVLHFVVMVWGNTEQFNYYHSEYNTSTGVWTHNGSFDSSGISDDSSGSDGVALAVRTNGNLVALIGAGDTDDWQYSINTGAGFGTPVALDASGSEAAIAVDGNDIHFVPHDGATFYHWHLDGTDTLGTKQTVASARHTRSNPQTVHLLVINGTMFFPSVQATSAGQPNYAWVTDAATGADSPTWTRRQVSTRDLAGGDLEGGLFWLLEGPEGPTAVIVEEDTWKIYRYVFSAGTWNEKDTGQTITVEDGDYFAAANTDISVSRGTQSPRSHVNGYLYGWYKRARVAAGESERADKSWVSLVVNLNPLEIHTTDAVLVDRKIPHTTDAHLIARPTINHTTDARLTSDVEPIAINHSTDARVATVATESHTTDAVTIVQASVDHSTDAVLVYEPIDLSTTVVYQFNVTGSLIEGAVPPAQGLGVHKRGPNRVRIYNPDHSIVRRN